MSQHKASPLQLQQEKDCLRLTSGYYSMTGALGSLILSGLFIGAALVTREWILLFGVVLAAGFAFLYSQNAGRRYAVLSSTGRHVVRSFSGLRRPLSRETFTTAEI